MLATLNMGMSLRDASLATLFFALLTCIPPAFMGIGGMETGMRQLVQARYSFGCVGQGGRETGSLPAC
jgi:purine-cytosine permease-like protein